MIFGQRRRVAHAALICRQGGVVAYPTESVYGLGCDPLNPEALGVLYDIKQRPRDKGVIIIADSVHPLNSLVRLPAGKLGKALMDSWPGPTTWVLPAGNSAPTWLQIGGKIAVRVTDHPVAAALARACGGIVVSTSANRAGHPPARSALKTRMLFGSLLDYVVPGPTGRRARPSGIRDGATGEWLRRP